jgi:hypothetical protein
VPACLPAPCSSAPPPPTWPWTAPRTGHRTYVPEAEAYVPCATVLTAEAKLVEVICVVGERTVRHTIGKDARMRWSLRNLRIQVCLRPRRQRQGQLGCGWFARGARAHSTGASLREPAAEQGSKVGHTPGHLTTFGRCRHKWIHCSSSLRALVKPPGCSTLTCRSRHIFRKAAQNPTHWSSNGQWVAGQPRARAGSCLPLSEQAGRGRRPA